MKTMLRRVGTLAVTLLLAAAVAACTRSSGSAVGRLTVDGRAEVVRPGEDRREVTGSRELEVGDRVRVIEGTAAVRLPDDRRFELRQGSDVVLQAGLHRGSVRPAVMEGDVLVVSDAEPLAVEAAGADVAVQGDARVSRGLVLLVAVYEGTARLSAGGSTLNVPALRQAALPTTGPFPTTVSPLEYSPADPWDQRYLSDAIELGGRLDARSEGFTAQLGPGEGRSFNYFRDLFPKLAAEPGFTASLVSPARAPGETLVGAAIALEGRRGSFAERWAAVFGFRDQGAPWGLVALDQGVGRTPLLETVERAASRGPTSFAGGPPPRGTGPQSPSTGSGGTTGGGPRATTTTAPPRSRPGASATTTTTAPPPTTPTTAPRTGPLNTGSPVDDPVNSLVNTLTGLLKSLGQQ